MRLQFYSLAFTLVALNSCADQSEFKGADGVRKATPIPKGEIQTESPVQLTASCEIEATRVSPGAGKCNVSVTTTGDLGSAKPQLTPSAQESAWVVNENVFSSTAPCSEAGGKITATMTAAGEGQPAFKALSCDVDVPAVPTPQCEIQVDKNTLTLGEALAAKVLSNDEAIDETQLNAVRVGLGQNVNFTPTSVGSFVLNATVRRGTTSGSCTKSVTVNPAPTTGTVKVNVTVTPVPAPNCALRMERQNAASTRCDVILNSTGGAFAGAPVAQGVTFAQTGTEWKGSTDCAASGASISATLTGSAGVQVQCSASVPALPASASCSLTATRIIANPKQCRVHVASTGGAISGLPVIAGSATLVQSGSQWTGVVPCALAGGAITATVNGATTGSSQCSATVAAPIWVQTNGGVCSTVCSSVKRISGRSPNYKNFCVSGEDRGDAVGIRYIKGEWGGGVEFYQTTSLGNRCYGSNPSKGQKQDNDATDITMGCYCL